MDILKWPPRFMFQYHLRFAPAVFLLQPGLSFQHYQYIITFLFPFTKVIKDQFLNQQLNKHLGSNISLKIKYLTLPLNKLTALMSKKSLCDEQVYSKIFIEYSTTLFNYLYYKCGDKSLAKDITQEAFLKLWQHCKNVNYETAKGYVFKIANNTLLNNYAKQKVRLKFSYIKQKEHTNESPEFILETKELQQQIDKAIAALPEKQRVVFLLSRIDKKTYKEIADILGISRQAVEKRIYNALDTLRKISTKIK